MSEHVLVADDGPIRRITMARPSHKNALSMAMYDAMTAALTEAAGREDLRVVVFTGQGGDFSAGNDLQDFLAQPDGPGEDSPVVRFLRALLSFPKPVVAAVRGVAVGIGTTLLLHCDLAYCAPDARFILPFAQLGLVPEAASSRLLPLAVGHRRAFELLVLGTPASAEEALRDGIVNGVVDDPEAAADRAARGLAALDPGAVAASKALIRQGPEAAGVDAVLSREFEVFGERMRSDAFRAAVERFLARRKG